MQTEALPLFARKFSLPLSEINKIGKLLPFAFGYGVDSGPWLCGGSILRWFNREGPGDFDIFCKSRTQEVNILKAMNVEFKVFSDSDYAYTYNVYGNKVQIVKHSFHNQNTLEGILNKIDFTVCHFGISSEAIMFNDTTLQDAANKELKLHHINFADGTLRRIIKYTKRGYTIDHAEQVSFLLAIRNDDIPISKESTIK